LPTAMLSTFYDRSEILVLLPFPPLRQLQMQRVYALCSLV
jgi:hypothetical protein